MLEASADGGALKTERKGVSLYDVRVLGRAAHAGLEPERASTPPSSWPTRCWSSRRSADPAAGTTVTPTVTRAGTTTNTVPGRRRRSRSTSGSGPLAEQERVDAAMRSLRTVVPGASLEVTGGPNRPPLEAAASAALFERAARARRAARPARAAGAAAVGGASDGNFTAGVGTPTLDGLGAVGGGAHADDEHVLVDALPGRTALLARAGRGPAGGPDARPRDDGCAPDHDEPGEPQQHGPRDAS